MQLLDSLYGKLYRWLNAVVKSSHLITSSVLISYLLLWQQDLMEHFTVSIYILLKVSFLLNPYIDSS